MLEAFSKRDLINWVIVVRRPSPPPVPFRSAPPPREVGALLDHWGRRIASKRFRSPSTGRCRRWFTASRPTSIRATMPSRRVLERLGFCSEGVLRERFFVGDDADWSCSACSRRWRAARSGRRRRPARRVFPPRVQVTPLLELPERVRVVRQPALHPRDHVLGFAARLVVGVAGGFGIHVRRAELSFFASASMTSSPPSDPATGSRKHTGTRRGCWRIPRCRGRSPSSRFRSACAIRASSCGTATRRSCSARRHRRHRSRAAASRPSSRPACRSPLSSACPVAPRIVVALLGVLQQQATSFLRIFFMPRPSSASEASARRACGSRHDQGLDRC